MNVREAESKNLLNRKQNGDKSCFMTSERLTEHVNNGEVLKNMRTRKSFILKIKKRQLKSLGHIMRKDDLEKLILTRSVG